MEVAVVLVDFEEVENVGVSGEEVEDFGLLIETLTIGGVHEEGFVDGFAGVRFAGQCREAAVDDPESTTAKLFAKLVLCFQALSHDKLVCCGEVGGLGGCG